MRYIIITHRPCFSKHMAVKCERLHVCLLCFFILSFSFLFLSFCYSFVHGSAAKKQIPTDTPTQTRIYITKGNEIICIIIIALCVFGLVGLFFISCGVFDLLHLLWQEHRSTYTTIPFLMKMISKN